MTFVGDPYYQAELYDTIEAERIRTRRAPRAPRKPDVPAARVYAPTGRNTVVRGTCPYCSALTAPGSPACRDHIDLVELDPDTATVTRRPTVTRRTA